MNSFDANEDFSGKFLFPIQAINTNKKSGITSALKKVVLSSS